MVSQIAPTHLVLILGRGTGKTTDIIAKRLMDICYDMPGAYVAISSDTYMNAVKNVLPSIIEGWERNGWIEGIHFVVGVRPPKNFYPKKIKNHRGERVNYGPPYKPPISWKHTITVFTGTHFKLISQDRPSTGAGDSYQSIVADEIKYQAEAKFNKLSPALRGEFVRFGHSPYYGSTTMTTDMPNPNHGEHDWFLRHKKSMRKQQIKAILYAADELNKARIDRMKAEEDKDHEALEKADRDIEKWDKEWRKLRKDSTFFYVASSFVNIAILRVEYFKTILKKMNVREILTSILSIPPTLEKGQMFYPNLGAKNFYSDGYKYSNIDKSNDGRDIEINSLDLKYCNPDQPLKAGLDTGKMCSLVIGQQESLKIERILKFFHTLPPEFLPELGEQVRVFFNHHRNKVLKVWHDPANNQWQSVGEDHATKFKKAIEYDLEGNRTDWDCQLMNRERGTIYHQTEYELMLQMMVENNTAGLPLLMIDQNECAPLKSAMQRTELIMKINRKGEKTLHKDKSSESLPNDMLPFYSTNPTDALKYYVTTIENLELIAGETVSFGGDPSIH